MNTEKRSWWILFGVGIVLFISGICDYVRWCTVGKDILMYFPDRESIRAIVNNCFLNGTVKTVMGLFLMFFSFQKNRNSK